MDHRFVSVYVEGLGALRRRLLGREWQDDADEKGNQMFHGS